METDATRLDRLENVLSDAWNGDAGAEEMTEALEDAIDWLSHQIYMYASIRESVVRRDLDGGTVVRAVACEDPGRAPRLFLEHVVLGAEDLPLTVARRVEVEQPGLNSVGRLVFEGDKLLFTTDPKEDPQRFSVEATMKKLGDRAVPA